MFSNFKIYWGLNYAQIVLSDLLLLKVNPREVFNGPLCCCSNPFTEINNPPTMTDSTTNTTNTTFIMSHGLTFLLKHQHTAVILLQGSHTLVNFKFKDLSRNFQVQYPPIQGLNVGTHFNFLHTNSSTFKELYLCMFIYKTFQGLYFFQIHKLSRISRTSGKTVLTLQE